MKKEWEKLVAKASRYNKGFKREDRVWLILSTLFLLFLISIACLFASESRLSLLAPLTMLSEMALYSPAPSQYLHEGEPSVKGTSIVGRDAVKKFRDHLDCFSESGKWVYDPTPRHMPWNYIGDQYTNACENRHELAAKDLGLEHVVGDLAEAIAGGHEAGNWSVREELKWVWQTNSSCPWRSFNRDQFCHKVGAKGHIMVVGDSINHEISWALMNALVINGTGYERLDSNTRFIIGPYEMCSDIFGDGRGFNISYICNVHLTAEGHLRDFESIEYPWIDFLDKYDTKILFLNRGAHYEEDEMFANTLRNTFSILTRRFPHIHVIFRNTPPGHMHCQTISEPLAAHQTDFEGLHPDFHWDQFHLQNEFVKKIVEEFDYTYMDVYSILSLRPEGHISDQDCLHYCLPGPLDIVTEYLYNILLLL